MAPVVQKGRRRWPRTLLRALRRAILLLMLGMVGALVYLNQVGLPDFLKRPILQRLHERGVDIHFSRLRLRFHRGIVAESVYFGMAQSTNAGPRLLAREAQVKLNGAALKHFQFIVDSVNLEGGEFILPVTDTNRPGRRLIVEDIQTQLQFLPQDEWELGSFKAKFAGANLKLSASITNASALRDWKMLQGAGAAEPEKLERQIKQFADTIEQIHFNGKPDLELTVQGDAKDPQSFSGKVMAELPQAETPWGSVTNGYLAVHLQARDVSKEGQHAELTLHADNADTPWGNTHNIQLEIRALSDENQTNLMHGLLVLQAENFQTEWCEATNAQFKADWRHSLTNAVPVAGNYEVQLSGVKTRWGEAGRVRVAAQLETPTADGAVRADESWGWWSNCVPYHLVWDGLADDVKFRELEVKEITFGGTWNAPELIVTNLHSEQYGGEAMLNGKLDVATRVATFKASSDFDAHRIGPFLGKSIEDWLGQFEWEKPPLAVGEGRMTFPAWTNRQPDWQAEVLPSAWFSGSVQAGACSFKGVPFTAARWHLTFSNMVTHLTDFVLERHEGRLNLEYVGQQESQQFYFKIRSDVDVKAAQRLLDEKLQKAFEWFSYAQPPKIDAEIWGNWKKPEQTGVKAHVVLTNFTFRGESVTNLHTDVTYTNHYLSFKNPYGDRGPQQTGTALNVDVDFDQKKLFVTNGVSTIDPWTILNPIGEKVAEVMQPYKFGTPPLVHCTGVFPIALGVKADAHFEVEGGPFHWLRFNLKHVVARVDWVGDKVDLNASQAEFYGGQGTGSASLDFTPNQGMSYAFETTVSNADLHAFISDMVNPTNKLEGRLNCHLKITQADLDDWESWFGSGQVELKDGLIWDIPVFGVFSPILDSIVDGLGKSRANEASGTFVITNSVIRSGDLKIQASGMRMAYRGTVDFQGNVNATVEAELLRNTPVVGQVISYVFMPLTKLLEYNVTGTMYQPKTEPRFLVSRAVLHPFGTLLEMIPILPGGTNAAPMVPYRGPQ